MTPSVYISVEESIRELASKLLVAASLAERGMNTIIGQQWLLNANLEHLPPGLVLFKGNNGIQHNNMRAAKKAGHLVVSIEEEAFGTTDEPEFRSLFAPGVDSTCDLFLSAGQFHRDLLERLLPGTAGKIAVTGNPRIDFFRPEFLAAARSEGERLRQKHGRFVLCNLNYAGCNTVHGDSLAFYENCVAASIFQRDNPVDDQRFHDNLQFEAENLRAMTKVIGWLQRNCQKVSILVRPHPAEQFETWETALAGRERIELVRGGSHMPWTFASEVMVHTSCTTGVEAYLAGQTAVSICPGRNPLADSYLSNLVNPRFEDAETACRYVDDLLEGRATAGPDTGRFQSVLNYHLEARQGRLSADRVADVIMEQLPAPAADDEWKVGPGFVRDQPLQNALAAKMSTTLADVTAELVKLQSALNRFRGLTLTEVGRSLFRLGS